MERYELIEGSAAKFWQWEVLGTDVVVRYGRIGTAGQTSSKSYATPVDAVKAAAKLVREKVGKGYALAGGHEPDRAGEAPAVAPSAEAGGGRPVGARPGSRGAKARGVSGAGSAARKKAPSDPAPTVSAPVEGFDAALAAKLTDAVASHNGFHWLAEQVGWRRAKRVLWRLAASRSLPSAAIGELLWGLARNVEEATPDELVAVLQQVPTELRGADAWLKAYPRDLDAIVVHAAHRAPKELAAAEAGLPPNVRRALPWVRRRLGQPTEAPAPELLAEHVALCLADFDHGPLVWRLEGGRLVATSMWLRFDLATEVGGALATPEAFVQAVRERAFVGGERAHRVGWRALPVYLDMPEAKLPQLVTALVDEPNTLVAALVQRDDPPRALVGALAKLTKATRGAAGELVAAVAARGFARAGQAVPDELDTLVSFRHRKLRERQRDVYLEGLRAFPRERLLARADKVFQGKEEPLDAFIALRAHWDEARFVAMATKPSVASGWGGAIAVAGPEALAPLIRVLQAGEADGTSARAAKVGLRCAFTHLVASSDAPVDPATEHWLEKNPSEAEVWRAAVARLPQDRRDARILADHEGRVEDLSALHLASDAAIEVAIGRLFEARKRVAKQAHALRFDALGPRATPALVRWFGKADAAAIAILDQTGLDDATYATLAGTAAPSSAPVVAAPPPARSIADGAAYLARVAPLLSASEPVGRLQIPSGRIALVKDGVVEPGLVLGRAVPAGEHGVHALYSDDEDALDALPTAGLEAVMVRFGEEAPVRWEEAADEEGRLALTREVVKLTFLDARRAAAWDGRRLADLIQEMAEKRICHGDAVGLVDDRHGVVAYVGEVAHAHALHWGLGSSGRPACLVAAFELPRRE